MPSWEVFTRGSLAAGPVLLFTIRAEGRFVLNRAAYDALGQPEYVELLYDREAQLIGVRSADEQSKDAYVVKKQSRGDTYGMSGAAFCKHYDIQVERSQRYVATIDNGDLVVNWRQQAHSMVTPGRPRGRAPHRRTEP